MFSCAFDPTGISETLAATFAATSTTAAAAAPAATAGLSVAIPTAGGGTALASTVAPTIAAGAAAGSGVSLGAASLAATAAGGALQTYGQMKAQGAERAMQNLQLQRQQQEVVRQSRISFAKAKNAAANQGAGDTSSAQGGQGSIISQAGGNLSFLDEYTQNANKATEGNMFAGLGSSLERTGSYVFGSQNRVGNIFG